MKNEKIIGGNYLAMGLGISLILGSAFGNMGLWLGAGGGLGILMEVYQYRKIKSKEKK